MTNAQPSAAIPFAMWRAAVLITMQSLSYGYVFSALNSGLVTGDNNSGADCYNGSDTSCPPGTIYNDINLTLTEAQVATSLTILGAWFGSLVSTRPSEVYGKRLTLMCNAVFFLVGAAMTGSGSIAPLFIGRFISGIGVGFTSGVPGVLLAEIASAETRGTVTTLHQLGITMGILIVGLIGYGLVTYVDHGWQYVQGFGAIPTLIMLIFSYWVPESPKWQLLQAPNALLNIDDFKSNQYYPQVHATIASLRAPGHDVDKEILSILADAKMEDDNQANNEVTWAEVFLYKEAIVIGVGLLSFQAVTGINSVIFYSSTVFGLAGFDQSIVATACVGAINVLTTIIATYLIDFVGRRTLLLTGLYIMLVSLLILSSVLLSNVDTTTQGIVSVVMLLAFVAGFAIGIGAVAWVVMAEVMPTRVRMKGVFVFLSGNWIFNLIIGLLTLTAIDGLGGVKSSMDDDETATAEKSGVAYLYFIFAGFTFLCLVFTHVCIPETRGMTPEELQGTWSWWNSASGVAVSTKDTEMGDKDSDKDGSPTTIAVAAI